MWELRPEELGEWFFERIASEPPPPAYTLAYGTEQAASPAGLQAEELQRRGIEVLSANPEFGSVDFLLPPSPTAFSDRADALLAACRRIDEREYVVGETDEEASGEGWEIRSLLPEAGLPVLGPGGGALMVAGAKRVYGTLTVRRRVGERPSEGWTAPGALSERVAGARAEVELFAELGYFEASARERQRVLRPVVMVVLEHEADPEQELDVGWRRLLIEPATDLAELPASAGIDLWYEPEGVLP